MHSGNTPKTAVGRCKPCGGRWWQAVAGSVIDTLSARTHLSGDESSSTMSYNLKETQGGSSKPTPEERKGLLSNFDVEDRDNGEPPRYEDEEYPEPRKHAPLRKKRIACIAGGFITLILGASFLVPLSRAWCCGMGAASRPTDPSKLLSNGTHEFKRTVLIVSIDGLR